MLISSFIFSRAPWRRPTPALRRLAVIALLGLVAGCVGDASIDALGARSGPTQHARTPERWTLAEHPDLIIGVAERDAQYHLGEVVGVVSLPDGRLVVADRQAANLRVYDDLGRHLADWGGGELTEIRRIFAYRGDSVAVFERSGNRVAILAPNGLVRRAFRPAPNFSPQPESLFTLIDMDVIGAFADGRFAVVGPERVPRVEGVRRGVRPVRFYSPSGHRADSVGVVPGREVIVRLSPRTVILKPDFSPPASFTVTGDRMYYGTGEQFVVSVADSRFEPLTQLHGSRPLAPISYEMREERDRFLDFVRAENALAPDRERVYPEFLPAFDAIVVGSDGDVWVRRYAHDSNTTEFTIFTRGGLEKAQLQIPHRAALLHASTSHVFLLERDRHGVDRIRRYKIRRWLSW